MPHTHTIAFHPRPLSFSYKLFFDVGNTLIITQRESEKKKQKSDSELKILQRVRFRIRFFYILLDFELTIL